MSVRTLAKSVGVGRFATGTYTGNGAATQAIVGVGFQPKFVIVYPQSLVYPLDIEGWGQKTDQDGVNASFYPPVAGLTQYHYEADQIISLDADGFTVGDGTPYGVNIFNINAVVYTYVAWG